MANIELLIKISEDDYKEVKEDTYSGTPFENRVFSAIANGTPLPKGHGELKDADELKKTIQENDVLNMTGFNVRLCDINNTPTIIEADKESE